MKLSSEPRPCCLRTSQHKDGILLLSIQVSEEEAPPTLLKVSCPDELPAGWGANLHLSLNSPWRLRPVSQAWEVLPQTHGHAVPLQRPSPSVPEATKPPGTTGFRTAVGGPRRAWLHLGSHLVSVLLPESLENQKCTAWDGLFLRASRSHRTCGWLLEKEYHWPSSPPTVFFSCPTWLCGWSWLVPLAGALNFSLNESFLCWRLVGTAAQGASDWHQSHPQQELSLPGSAVAAGLREAERARSLTGGW